MVADNGGANAIKGMNYQNAVISLVAIRNYEKEGFELILEADDDFEVLYDNYHAYIQVKGEQKMSLSKMLNQKKEGGKEKKSMLDKHFKVGDSKSIYKFVVYNFTQSDLDKMKETDDELFNSSLKLSKAQEERINNSKTKRFSIIKTFFAIIKDNLKYIDCPDANVIEVGKPILLSEKYKELSEKLFAYTEKN